jgi:hypothetical protein
MQAEPSQAPVAQAETAPADREAPASTGAQVANAVATAPANVNQQLLAQLIGMNTTLMQLLELERAKAAAVPH